MINDWRPLGDRVLIRQDKAEAKTEKGIILPAFAQMSPPTGVVLRVSEDHDRPLIVKEGDKVYFGVYAGTPVEVDGEELLMLRESEIFAIEG